MQEDRPPRELQGRGFTTDLVPTIADRVDDCFMVDDDGEMKRWYRVIPRYERSDDFKAAQKELEEIAERQAHLLDVRMDRAMREEAARKKRKAAHKKKAATERKKKTSTKRPSKKKSE